MFVTGFLKAAKITHLGRINQSGIGDLAYFMALMTDSR
jgi:hypothetical protein